MGRWDREKEVQRTARAAGKKGMKFKDAQNVCSKCAAIPCVCEQERGRAAAAAATRSLAKAQRVADKKAAKAAKQAKKGK